MPKASYEKHIQDKFSQWLDNTDPDNLGIVKWAKDLLPEYVRDATPEFHKELYMALLQLFNPNYRNKMERMLGITSWRGSSKSTVINMIFTSYIIANNGRVMRVSFPFPLLSSSGEVIGWEQRVIDCKIEERFIVIISETATSAEDFTVRIRDEFLMNTTVRYYYRFEVTDAVDAITGQLTKKAFRINKCFVLGVGAKQQFRGKIKGASRPTLVIADDIYSYKSVVTEDSRRKIRRWWQDEVENGVDDKTGKIILIGTIVHDDTVLVDIENNKQWKKIKQALMPIESFHKFIRDHLKVDYDLSACDLPFEDEPNDIVRATKQKKYFDDVQADEDWGLSWPERVDLYYIALKYQKSVRERSISGFYQEYFHKTVSPQDRKFKKEHFVHISNWDYQSKYGHNWIKFNDSDWLIINTEIGIDLSSGEGKDDGVITVGGSLKNGKRVVIMQSFGKYSLRDILYGDTFEENRLDKVCIDRSRIERIGVIDETFRLALRFNVKKIKIGVAGEEKTIVNEFRRVFEANRLYGVYVGPRKQTTAEGKKIERILNGLIAYYETMSVIHCGDLSKLEYQLEYLGKADSDDLADSLEVMFYNLDQPVDIEIGYFKQNGMEISYPKELTFKNLFDWRTS
ncbi:MAG: hypothetical protein Q8940_07405 [Bacteroidota bacterium]|nr:hypothetical protein [Bacteroidota bacterium]